ncbi:hypothetical protein J1614_003359 [Plenodomus biglobosus]|nr:hypothetical protein J1614_003359 [Plenodomus biglobosus]
MTAPFTPAQAHGPGMCDAIGSPSRAFVFQTDEVPTVLKENTDPHCTPPSSPTKQARPTTPKSTPLHRRFLQEVSMSPASPATPATPPRTPSRTPRDSPTKDRESPTKARATPTKNHGSPARLEIGQNGFYFSCEIPISKVVPKKQASPQKGSRAGTPTRRTPSPLKNETPVKRNRAKTLFGTPTGKTIDSAKDQQAGNLATRSIEDGSPAWRSSKIHSKEARDLMSVPVTPLRIPPECLSDVTEQDVRFSNAEAPSTTTTSHQAQSRPSSAHSAKDTRPENIGHMMARLTSGTFKTHDWTHAHQGVDPIKSPAPTPLRKASLQFGSVAPPPFLKLDADECTVAVDDPTKTTGRVSPVHTQESRQVVKKYFDESKRVKSPAIKWGGTLAVPKMRPACPNDRTTKASPAEGENEFGGMAAVRPSPYPALLFPGPRSEAETVEGLSSNRSEKHVQWRGPVFSPAKFRHQPSSLHRRAGTDPEVYLAMKRDMASMGENFRRSIGSSVLSPSSRLNTNELPTMSNGIFMRDLDATKPKITPEAKARGRLTRWNSDTPAVCPTRPNDLMREKKQRAATLTGPGVPMWHPTPSTPNQMLRQKFAASKDASKAAPSTGKAATVTTPQSRPVKPVSNKLSKAPLVSVTTPRRQQKISGPTLPPTRPMIGTPAKKQTPTLPLSKSKPIPPATPRGATKPKVSHTPAPRKTPITRPPASARKSKPKTTQPYDPTSDPRPYEEKFASASIIAERVTQWHIEEREKNTNEQANMQPSKAPSKAPSKSVIPNAIPAEESKSTTPNESSTPPGSPPIMPLRIAASPTKLPIRTATAYISAPLSIGS